MFSTRRVAFFNLCYSLFSHKIRLVVCTWGPERPKLKPYFLLYFYSYKNLQLYVISVKSSQKRAFSFNRKVFTILYK